MALDFPTLLPQIDAIIDDIGIMYQEVPGAILTEDDLKCLLYNRLTQIPQITGYHPTQDLHILGSAVHAELSWYGEYRGQYARKLCIKPDITILEPENYSILHGFIGPTPRITFTGREIIDNDTPIPPHEYYDRPPLPNKQFEFGGNAITFELKLARRDIDRVTLRKIQEDHQQINRLYRILQSQGQQHSIFSYLVVFSKINGGTAYEEFQRFCNLRRRERHLKVIYKTANVNI